MREISLKVGNSPQYINDYERYCASCINKLLSQLKLELGIDYSIGQGGTIKDWNEKDFGLDDGLFIILSIKKWKMKKKTVVTEGISKENKA